MEARSCRLKLSYSIGGGYSGGGLYFHGGNERRRIVVKIVAHKRGSVTQE